MENKKTLPQEVKGISIVFMVLFTGLILFLAVSVGLNLTRGPFLQNPKFTQIFMGAVIILSVICLYLAHSGYNKRMLPEVYDMKTVPEKLEHYRLGFMKYMSLVEAPAIFAIIGFMLTGYFLFLVITFILLLNMLLKRPSRLRLISDLQLNSNEQLEL